MTTAPIRAFIGVVEGILKKRQREYHFIKRLVEVTEEGEMAAAKMHYLIKEPEGVSMSLKILRKIENDLAVCGGAIVFFRDQTIHKYAGGGLSRRIWRGLA